jgi:lipopolysaccharide transport system ATP-binding protein
MWFSAHVVNPAGIVVMQCDSRLVGTWVEDCERITGQFWFSTPWLKPGTYRVDLFICALTSLVDVWEGACSLTISPVLPYQNSACEDVMAHGVVFGDFAWEASEVVGDTAPVS